MEDRLIVFIVFLFVRNTSGGDFQLCINREEHQTCSIKALGDLNSEDAGSCDVEYIPRNSPECKDGFSSTPTSEQRLGQITIKPFILESKCTVNDKHSISVPNIIFSDIKWKKLKFRITEIGSIPSRHCRRLAMPHKNVTVETKTVTKLHYDCYKSITDGSLNTGTIHVLDVEATDGVDVDQRKFLFYLPALQMLGTTTNETIWKPFVYVEKMVTSMQLRIVPPPVPLNVTYQIEVKKKPTENVAGNSDADEIVAVESIVAKSLNSTLVEEIYDYSPTSLGYYYFVVTIKQGGCMSCNSVKSPPIYLVVEPSHLSLYLVIIASLLAVAFVMWILYRRCNSGLPATRKPPKVLVIYPSQNTIHAECVKSFVEYLRSEYGFDILYDDDIQNTSHCDPYYWADEAIGEATHIMYIVGPKTDRRDISGNYTHNAMYNVDKLLLSFLKAKRPLQNKNVINVYFEHSDGILPNETRNDRAFFLLNDWQKLIAYLSRDLLPKQQIMRTKRGKNFIEDLTRVNRLLKEPSVV
ncbi:uncharacterized protein LOC112045042 [Bicyclus anynana]|uniref:Uncharacterized protein LOC112045042 n=1 Tax=Bicyclus anynana TaxID=110368 RepID=A0A6J1MMT7_BICAN|nr:uncharacterized protein LOC112045042 [Bicyclus anynana]